MSDGRCGYEWPQTQEELARAISDCPHYCGRQPGHSGPHRCGDGAEAS